MYCKNDESAAACTISRNFIETFSNIEFDIPYQSSFVLVESRKFNVIYANGAESEFILKIGSKFGILMVHKDGSVTMNGQPVPVPTMLNEFQIFELKQKIFINRPDVKVEIADNFVKISYNGDLRQSWKNDRIIETKK